MGGRFITVILLLALIGAGVWWFSGQGSVDPTPMQQSTDGRYSNDEFGISFDYPQSYQLEEREVGNGERRHYAITLIRESDLPLPQNGEGPPSINIDIYQNNLDKLPLMDWVTGTSFSNFKLGNGQYATTTVYGADAVAYRWSGLYEGHTVAFAHRDNIIAVSGTYLTLEDQIVRDFAEVVVSMILH